MESPEWIMRTYQLRSGRVGNLPAQTASELQESELVSISPEENSSRTSSDGSSREEKPKSPLVWTQTPLSNGMSIWSLEGTGYLKVGRYPN